MTSKKRSVPTRRDALRPVDKAFIHSVMFDLGIVPIEDPVLDMRVPIKQLTAEEARVVKRKFRKLWRKCMKKKIGNPTGKGGEYRESSTKRDLGVGKKVPSRRERLERKRMVFNQIWNDVIVPMLTKFENPERNGESVNDTPT